MGSASARSSTKRAIGPIVVRGSFMALMKGKWPVSGSRPVVGFSPLIPQACAGWRMLPPESDPRPSGEPPAAISAASPLLLPVVL